ncbi:MAG: hypothetical protein U9O96_00970 [Candidatus Thermoplasmatota archaeon]|nr:hypothetical protein [Candidatus Thermoplasmatota archaeon]
MLQISGTSLDEKVLVIANITKRDNMGSVFVFKVALKHRKGIWRRIEIRGSQMLKDFDQIIRETFKHDTMDHLGEFFREQWPHGGFGEIDPFGGGNGARKRIEQLGLTEGDKLGYIYDFGDNIQHIVTLEKVTEPESGVEYPRIVSQNDPKYRYCETCKKRGKKTIATWICITCSNEKGREVLLCEDCVSKEHDDHYAEEMVY